MGLINRVNMMCIEATFAKYAKKLPCFLTNSKYRYPRHGDVTGTVAPSESLACQIISLSFSTVVSRPVKLSIVVNTTIVC